MRHTNSVELFSIQPHGGKATAAFHQRAFSYGFPSSALVLILAPCSHSDAEGSDLNRMCTVNTRRRVSPSHVTNGNEL